MPCLYNLRAVTRKLLCTQLSAPTLANPPALCASPFAKGGVKGGFLLLCTRLLICRCPFAVLSTPER